MSSVFGTVRRLAAQARAQDQAREALRLDREEVVINKIQGRFGDSDGDARKRRAGSPEKENARRVRAR